MIHNAITLLQCALALTLQPVGVKFIFTPEEFAAAAGKPVASKISYCSMVRLAALGYSLKANAAGFGCISAGRALGIIGSNNFVISGRHYARHGLYDSRCTAKGVQTEVTFVRHKAYGVVVRPLADYDNEPDVVVLLVDPYQAMRVVQGYAYHFGAKKDIKLTGIQALCAECTATPYETNDLNMSVLCAGTRYLCNWEDSLMGLGMPFNKFKPIVEGVASTINAADPIGKKRAILARLQQAGLQLAIDLDKNYYSGLTGHVCNPEFLAEE